MIGMIHRRAFTANLGSLLALFGAGVNTAKAANPRLTIELRNTDGSVLTTLRLYKENKTWLDVKKDASPLNSNKGTVDDSAYNQLHCLDDSGQEMVRLANCNWDIQVDSKNSGFCYGCKIGFETKPLWYCTEVVQQ